MAQASFTRLNRADLAGLIGAADDEDPRALTAYLADNGTVAAEFEGDGGVFAVLLPVLAEDFDIDLETSENGLIGDLAERSKALVVILTSDERHEYRARLDPESFDPEELGQLYADFTEEEDEDQGEAMLAGIIALHEALGEVDDSHVVVLMVG
ncbi:hypothetical protein [Acidocella sp.]|uniref:hypothetical protein n=2 Tax=Acidocella sp. TaxID=50710 RepID=UPI00261897E7|nr:hypothetical protein [Acidocella sp.]